MKHRPARTFKVMAARPFMTRAAAIKGCNELQAEGLRTVLIGEPWDAYFRYYVWYWEKPDSRRVA